MHVHFCNKPVFRLTDVTCLNKDYLIFDYLPGFLFNALNGRFWDSDKGHT